MFLKHNRLQALLPHNRPFLVLLALIVAQRAENLIQLAAKKSLIDKNAHTQ